MTAKRTTYDLLHDTIDLLDRLQLAETDEEALAILEEQLELEGELARKLERLHAVHRRMSAEAALLREEEQRLAGRRQRIQRAEGRVRELAYMALCAHRELCGESRVVTPTITARLQRSPARLVAPEDPEQWPEAYVTHTPQLDRRALRAALMSGDEVPGCRLEQSEHLRWG